MEPCQPAELEPGQQVAEAVAAILCGPADPRLKRAGEGAGGVRDGRMGGIAPQVGEYSDAGVADRDLEASPTASGPVYTWAAIKCPFRTGAMVDRVIDQLADSGEDIPADCRAA